MVFMGAAVFFVGPIRTIHAPADHDPTSPSTANLLFPGFPSTEVESMLYNYFLYVVPFLVGLHYRLLDTFPFFTKMFTAVTWTLVKQTYSVWQYLFVTGLILVTTANAAFHIFLFYQADLLQGFGPAFAGIVLLLFTLKFALRKTHRLNLRYFMIFGVLGLFTPFQNFVSAVSQALLFGFTVEGISTKGIKPLFLRLPYSHSAQPSLPFVASEEGQAQGGATRESVERDLSASVSMPRPAPTPEQVALLSLIVEALDI